MSRIMQQVHRLCCPIGFRIMTKLDRMDCDGTDHGEDEEDEDDVRTMCNLHRLQ